MLRDDLSPQSTHAAGDFANEAIGFDTAIDSLGALIQSMQLEVERQGMTRNHWVPQTLSQLARMGWSPSSDQTRLALEHAVVRAAARMTESDVRNSLWSLATLGWAPTVNGVRESLELALARMVASMHSAEVVDSVWALATLGWRPLEGGLCATLELALQRVLPSLGALELARTVWALSKLDWRPVSVGLRSLLPESEAAPPVTCSNDGEHGVSACKESSSGLEAISPVDDGDDEVTAGLEHEADGECAICFELMAEMPGDELATSEGEPMPVTLTVCDHRFHTKCLASAIIEDRKHKRQPSCPMCRGLVQDVTPGDVESSSEVVLDREWIGVGAGGSGVYDPAFDASAIPNCHVAPNPGHLGMRAFRSSLCATRKRSPVPRLFACTQLLPGGRVSSSGDPMHTWRIGTIQSYNRSMGAYKVRFNDRDDEEWNALDIDVYGTHGEYEDGDPTGGHWVLLNLPSPCTPV
jgi:hypothetical protein